MNEKQAMHAFFCDLNIEIKKDVYLYLIHEKKKSMSYVNCEDTIVIRNTRT